MSEVDAESVQADLDAIAERVSQDWYADSLDAAWAEAEAALPERHHIKGVEHRWSSVALNEHADGSRDKTYTFPSWHAYSASAYSEIGPDIEAWGDTPALALRTLAAALRSPGEPRP